MSVLYNGVGLKVMFFFYRNDENASQSRTGDNEDSATEKYHQAHLLQWFEASFPEHR
jgi:hypothetical protein